MDYLIDKNGEITAIEVKWSDKKSGKLPNLFTETYHPKHTFVVNSDNYAKIIAEDSLDYLDD